MTFSRVCQKSGKAEYKGWQTLVFWVHAQEIPGGSPEIWLALPIRSLPHDLVTGGIPHAGSRHHCSSSLYRFFSILVFIYFKLFYRPLELVFIKYNFMYQFSIYETYYFLLHRNMFFCWFFPAQFVSKPTLQVTLLSDNWLLKFYYCKQWSEILYLILQHFLYIYFVSYSANLR